MHPKDKVEHLSKNVYRFTGEQLGEVGWPKRGRRLGKNVVVVLNTG